MMQYWFEHVDPPQLAQFVGQAGGGAAGGG
jgi:hypothetical protein